MKKIWIKFKVHEDLEKVSFKNENKSVLSLKDDKLISKKEGN